MAKRVLVLTLSLFLIASLGAFGAKKPVVEKVLPQEKIKFADESGIISRYVTTPELKYLPATGDTAGFSYYDYQHNNSQRRQIAVDKTGLLHMDWMDLVGPDNTNNRYIDYNNYDPVTSSWFADGGVHTHSPLRRGGYPGIDVLPDDREVIGCHFVAASPPDWQSVLLIEGVTPGLAEFIIYDIPDSVTGRVEYLEWPYIGISKDTEGTAYIHVTNYSQDDYGAYQRCYEDPASDNLICESPGWAEPHTIPPNTQINPKLPFPYIFPDGDGKLTYNAAPIATSPVSNKVAVAFYDQAAGQAFYKGDIYYIESTNNGDDWMAAGEMRPINRVTNYEATDWADYTFYYTEMAAVYDYNDVLHIIWTASPTGSEGEAVTLFHWSPATGVRMVGSRKTLENCGAWNYAIAKVTIGVECNPADPYYNFLYVVYTGFDDADVSAGKFLNGDLYKKVSSNGGLTWGPEENLTNTQTPGCDPGDCRSENWASVAERVDSFMYVGYIDDYDAGGIPQEEGTFTRNAFRLMIHERQGVPKVAGKVFAPPSFISPPEWAENGGSVQDTVKFDNVGTDTLFVKISGPGYVTITPSQFYIIEAGPTVPVDLTFSGAAFTDDYLADSLKVESNNGASGEVYSDIEWIKYHFVVTETFYFPEFDVCTLGVRLAVSNVGNLGHQEEGNQMFFNDHDYLFDCTQAFATDMAGYGKKGFTWLHDRKDYLAENHLERYDYPNLKVSVFYDCAAPINPTLYAYPEIHHQWQYLTKFSKIVNVHYDDFHVVMVKNWWKWNEPPVWWPVVGTPPASVSGYFGIAADWDVPEDASRRNNGDFDDTLHMIWLQGDTAGFENYYGAFLFIDSKVIKGTDTTVNTAPFGAHILNNATQLYPFGGYNDDSLFKYMSTPGYSKEQDSAQDMNIVMTFVEEANFDPTTVIVEDYVLIATDQGPTDLYNQAAKMKNIKAGDANVDGNVSVSDVVFLINYLFKGGDEPFMAFSDANGDAGISVSDVVYLINYLFKGGDPPVIVW